jgi:predicted nucleic acid-binding protein
MARVVLDSSAWIYLERVQGPLPGFTEYDQPIMAPAALAELLVAGQLSTRSVAARNATLKFVKDAMQIAQFLPIDELTSEIFADLKAFSREQGRPRGVNDLWIAATAIRADAELLTLDKGAYFEDLPGLILRR